MHSKDQQTLDQQLNKEVLL